MITKEDLEGLKSPTTMACIGIIEFLMFLLGQA